VALTVLLTGILASYFLIHRFGAVVVSIILLSIMLLYAQWGIGQFIVQHDFGLYLIGESRLGDSIAGVAKFSVGEQKLIRAYGPFEHPNEFAGMLVLALVMLASFAETRLGHNRTRYLYLLSFTFLLAVCLSFSRAAYLAIAILIILMAWRGYLRPWLTFITPLMILVALLLPLLVARLSDPQDVAVPERIGGMRSAWFLISQQPWFGSSDSYTRRLREYYEQRSITFQPWQIDFAHSVPLLLVVRFGILPILIWASAFFWLTARLYGRAWVWLLPFVPLLLLDHYFLTRISVLAWATVTYMLLPHFISRSRWYT
jgi:hypothetical protein